MGKKALKRNPEKAEDEVVDDVHAKKIGKQFYSRCSPTYFSNVMSEPKPILGEQQRMRISDSPFCKWIDMSVLAISSGRLDYFLNDFMFLRPVDLDLKMESRFLACHFASKVTKADRAAIRERMMLLAGNSEENEALVYESIPTLGVRRSLNVYPRLFRWGKSRIPLKSDEADTLLNRVDVTQVLPIQPFNEEENLVDLKRGVRSEDGMSEVTILEKIVIRQSEKIKLLGKRCGELEDQNMRHELNVKEAVVEKGEKSGEAEFEIAHDATCSFYDVDVVVHNVVELDEANKDVEGSEFSLSKVDEITVFQSSIVDNVRARADRVKKRKGSMFVTPPSSTPKRKTRVKKQSGGEELDEFRGRSDFIGHEKSSDEDRKLVIEFLGKEKLDVIVWEDEHMSLGGHALCTLLFREPVDSEIIKVYSRIMRQQSLLNGSEIFYMDTNVQVCVNSYSMYYDLTVCFCQHT
ncbi:hypothetical protein F511_24135 [Dorcoceras hygrometricum]|uniref:Uncharacterized protein n=1 Tax=Dorcoceras hygrometricum TaxID=472368 RepID=A0A2Z7BXX5_9LAMI|nr:hypothetical protein F511_24135 [Dorcoceras hygrometricum]